MVTAGKDAILIVAAHRRELAGLLARCRKLHCLHYGPKFAVLAELNGKWLLAVAGGAGSGPAARAAEQAFKVLRPRALISTGVCGALNAALRCGEVLAATEVRSLATGRSIPAHLPETSLPYRPARLLTVEHVVQTAREKRDLSPWADAVEMEAAALAAVAMRERIPFYAIRVVLDTAEESFVLDYERARSPEGSFCATGLLGGLLRRPWRGTAELVHLYWRLRRGVEKLGEFIASCRFPVLAT